MPDMQMILQHGWAIDSTVWKSWQSCADSLHLNVKIGFAERGYFLAPKAEPVFQHSGGFKVLVVHSLGLHLVSSSLLQAANLLVIVGGFAHFHAGSQTESRLSRIAVRKMLQKVDEKPIQVLENFYTNCGFPGDYCQDSISRSINRDLIVQDLVLLNQSSLNEQPVDPKDVLILHGQDDTIVPAHHAHHLKDVFKNSSIQIHPQGNHALPYLHPNWCLGKISEHCLVTRK